MLRLLWQELKFRRGAMLGWGIGLCFFPVVYIGIYPSVASEMGNLSELEIYKMLGMNLGTFSGWIASILIAFMPMVACIYAIINGTGTLAAEEEDGRLEMLVTLPLPRWQIVIVKALALSISIAVIFLIVAGVSWMVFIAIGDQVETDIVATDMFRVVLSALPLVLTMGMLSLFFAAFAPNRRIASTLAAVVLIVSYFGDNLSQSTDALDPLKPFFLYTYLDSTPDAVINGQQAGDVLVLALIGLIAFTLAIYFFEHRNLTVGVWPWQRPQVER
ncbi:MAG: ABC transporter permease subunit [Anaerolineales bacterium]